MGATLGRNSDDTANILGILQVLIQMHALSISPSLFQIARQWIHGSLLTRWSDLAGSSGNPGR